MIDLASLTLGGLSACAAGRGLKNLREHRSEPRGLADLLNWAFMVDDGVILQKDGSLLAGWKYRGPDVSAATAQELNTLSRHLNDALLGFGNDWMFHADAIRRPAVSYPASVFPDGATQIIDDERRASYNVRASRQYEPITTSWSRTCPRRTPSHGSTLSSYKAPTGPASTGRTYSALSPSP